MEEASEGLAGKAEMTMSNEAGAEDGGIPILVRIGRARPAASDSDR